MSPSTKRNNQFLQVKVDVIQKKLHVCDYLWRVKVKYERVRPTRSIEALMSICMGSPCHFYS